MFNLLSFSTVIFISFFSIISISSDYTYNPLKPITDGPETSSAFTPPTPLNCPSGTQPAQTNNNAWLCIPTNSEWNRDMGGRIPTDNGQEPNGNNKYSAEDQKANYEQCKASYDSAKRLCMGLELTPQASAALNVFSQYKEAGNVKEACKTAQNISLLSLGSNIGFGVTCSQKVRACETDCFVSNNVNKFRFKESSMAPSQMYAECQSFKGAGLKATTQALADAGNYLQSKACAEAADAKCVGQNAFSDPDCAQFCSQPGRESHPRCALAAANCQNPTFAQQNAQFCQCLQNPFAPNCSTAVNPIPRQQGNDPLAGLRPTGDGLGDLGEEDFLGNESTGNFGAGANPTQGGSGFSGGGGGSSPIAGDQGAGGSGDEPLDKDILTGQGGGGGGAGGFFGYGGGGGSEGSGGSRGSGGGEGSGGSGIDLRAFLPGGKNDPRRGLASAEEATGITRSDGLTNFQKVTRKINQKLVEGALNP